jgi:hypothetical protein
LEMVSVAPVITGNTLAFTFHMRCISVMRSLYFKILSDYYYYYYYYVPGYLEICRDSVL